MTIDQVVNKSRPYKGRKYENMTVLQRLRIDLLAEAQDYDHRMMHARSDERREHERIGDDLVTLAQDYAWRYAKHRQLRLLNKLLEQASDSRITSKDTIIQLMKVYKEGIESDLAEYQRQFKNMELM